MQKLSWTTDKRKVKDLVPYEVNPRKLSETQQNELKKSLTRFGLVEIPAIDADNKIIAGHQRLATLILLGRGDEIIDVRIPNRKLTDKEFQEYNIRSNKNTGDWDYTILFENFKNEDLLDWGFLSTELGIFENIKDPEIDIDSLNEKEEETEFIECPSCGHKFAKPE